MHDRVHIFNAPSDRARGRKLVLHPVSRFSERMYAGYETRKFFWTDVGGDGNRARLTAVEAYFTKGELLSGLRFVYGDGSAGKEVGVCSGERAVLCLGPTEKIGAIDVDTEPLTPQVLVVCNIHWPRCQPDMGRCRADPPSLALEQGVIERLTIFILSSIQACRRMSSSATPMPI